MLTVLSGALLLASAGQVTLLVPLFAIGVFVEFKLCQVGMLRHWSAVARRDGGLEAH
ncbi:MAG: hypothetical protein H0X35_11875 [Pseudonocardiales bacterium]|nr:hypothetical protein [Pseudonocardiales bacterium]